LFHSGHFLAIYFYIFQLLVLFSLSFSLPNRTALPSLAVNEQVLGAVAASQMFGRDRNFQIRTAVSAG
jgi:hypothetical protein